MAELNYFDATRPAPFDFSPLVHAGELYAAGGRDAGASIREAAASILSMKQRQREADQNERIQLQDRTARVWTNLMGEMGANRRAALGEAGADRRNREDNAAQDSRAKMSAGVSMFGNALQYGADMARVNANAQEHKQEIEAKVAAEAQKKANHAGAFSLLDHAMLDPKASPVQEMEVRAVDTDPSLGSIWAQGGEAGLVQHFTARGMEPAEASQAAKAALKPSKHPYLEPGRLARLSAIANDKYGPDASGEMLHQLGSMYRSSDKLLEDLRGSNASSIGQQFPGRTAGKNSGPRIEFGNIDEPDFTGLVGGDPDWQNANPAQKAHADSIGLRLAKENDPRLKGDYPTAPIEQVAEEWKNKFLTSIGKTNVEAAKPDEIPGKLADIQARARAEKWDKRRLSTELRKIGLDPNAPDPRQ